MSFQPVSGTGSRESRNASGGGNMAFIKPELNPCHLIDVLISPICHQDFANGPFGKVGGGLVLGLATANITHKHLGVLSVVFLSVVAINTSVDFLPPSVPSLHLCLSFSGSPV